MDGNLFPTLIFLPVLLSAVLPSSAGVLEPYDLLYDNAVEAFYSADYESVVRYMEGALSSHRQVRATRVRCRLRCQDQHPLDESFSDLRFFDSVLRRAACMNKCIEEKVGTQSLHKVSEDVVQDFNRRIPYNYLQQAYQKVRRGRRSELLELNEHYCCGLGGGRFVWLVCSALPAAFLIKKEKVSAAWQQEAERRENSRVLLVPVLRNVPHVHGACSRCVIVARHVNTHQREMKVFRKTLASFLLLKTWQPSL